MYYNIKQHCKICCNDTIPKKNFFACFPMSDIDFLKEHDDNLVEIVNIYKDLPYTRAEFFEGVLYGTIYIPALLNHETVHIIFVLDKDKLYLISDSDIVEKSISSIIKVRKSNLTDPGTVLYYFFEQLIDDDLEKINVVQDHLSQLEAQIFETLEDNYSKKLTNFRSKTLQLSHYYMQFSSLATLLSEDTYNYFGQKQLELFSSLSNRIMLLKNEADQLWDYTLQVREIYQEQMDVHQNEIMKFFTMITTVFFPLSLITGWYGMNFENMPELKGEYSYFVMIAASVIIVIVICILFKKKKLW